MIASPIRVQIKTLNIEDLINAGYKISNTVTIKIIPIVTLINAVVID